MERFDIRGEDWGFMERQDGLGAFTWAEEALAYRRSFFSSFFVNVMMVIICALLSAYLVYHKHDPQPVAQPRISAEEYEDTVREQRRLQVELATTRKMMADLTAKNAQLTKMVQTANFNNSKLIAQLKALAVSVPPQPVILEEIRKEASTDAGFRQMVARNFGKEIAGRVRVIE